MFINILVYGVISAYVGVVILGHVLLLQAILTSPSDAKGKPEGAAPERKRALTDSRGLSSPARG